MPVLKTRADNQQGAIMLMALMILMLVGVLGATLIEIGLMENKSSHYDWEAQQALQAADGGVEWGMERIYSELQQPANLDIETLPALLTCGNAEMCLAGNDGTGWVRIGAVVKKNSMINELGFCTYEYTSTGSFRGARKVLTVQIIYYYTGGYLYQDMDGKLSVMPRHYLDRGRIKNYVSSI